MWTEPVVTSAPASEPVSLAEAKAQCRVDASDYDTEINSLIAAARSHVEGYTGLKLVEQTVTFSRSGFGECLPLPVAPVQSATVAYLDTENASQTLSTDIYSIGGVDTLRPILKRNASEVWPSTYEDTEAVTVTAVTGFSVVPEAIKQAILVLVSHWFDNRDNEAQEMPSTVDALLVNYRIYA